MDVQPVTLTGQVVRLEPLALTHVPDLAVAGQDESIWALMPYGRPQGEAGMHDWVEDLLRRRARGTDMPFAVVYRAGGRAIGATRYMEIRPADRNLEIGGTWYAPQYQRTAVNTESKILLLAHAFETLGCLRVQFRTDVRNERSQRAIERLGATREGVLRRHMVMPDGYVRTSIFYSILLEEWPAVKQRLVEKLAAYLAPVPATGPGRPGGE